MPSAKLRLPKRFEETLQQRPGLFGAVLVSLDELDPWIADNKLPFFPEYTDHGPDHINEVFVTAEALIRDEAWSHVTPEDVAVLVLAILLHDCAMHVSEEGFLALLKHPDWSRPIVGSIDSVAWADLWDDFLREAARFDGKRLKKLFGDTEPAKPPPLDALKMTKRDRLLIGEFMRRHHPRLAHEIALHGVPGPTTTPLKLQNIERKLADLAGLVARSHGIDLRAATEILPADERRETRNVHAPFLMSVLRIADYLQIHAERAPRKLLQVKQLRSPVSVGEWKKHDAIETIHNRHDDPEALYVKALPQDGVTYVGLKWLFGSIQGELDDVWAVLGEVYGRVDDLRDLGIVIRRLRSNLDDEKEFAKTVDYVPGRAEFQTAGADLLKLLVGPLYGDKPEIGIRELLQNAVDACRELEDYLKQHPNLPAPSLTEQEADVIIAQEVDEEGYEWVTISDRGIGMTPDVVKDYFLKAGASFRNSDTWRKQHTDGDSHSRVLRSGRFGVGVLAAFLLGDELHVSTRHISAARGVEFEASIDDDVVSLRYVERPVGTTIRIRGARRTVMERTIEEHADKKHVGLAGIVRAADWYCLARPSALRVITTGKAGKKERIPPSRTLPDPHATLACEWRRVHHEGYADIQWSLWKKNSGCYCNGIRIRGAGLKDLFPDAFNWHRQSTLSIAAHALTVSVFDPDGRLPLNLQRDSIKSHPRLRDILSDDIWRDFIAHALVCLPGDASIENMQRTVTSVAYPGVRGGYGWFRFWATPHGWSVADPWFFQEAHLRSLVFVNVPGFDSYSESLPTPAPSDAGRIVSGHHLHTDHAAWLRAIILGDAPLALGPAGLLMPGGVRILLTRHRYDLLRQPRKITQRVWAKVDVEQANKRWVILKGGKCPNDSNLLHRFKGQPPKDQCESLAEYYLADGLLTGEYVRPFQPSRLARIWKDIVGIPHVPFDLAERRKVLAHAYEKLAPYVAAHEELLEKERAKRSSTPEDDNDEEDEAS